MWRSIQVGVMALILGCPAPARADEAEDRAAAFVEKLGGGVIRDDNRTGKPVVEVHLPTTDVTDEGLKELAPLKNLSILSLGGTGVTDAGLKELAPHKNLTELNLMDTEVTD